MNQRVLVLDPKTHYVIKVAMLRRIGEKELFLTIRRGVMTKSGYIMRGQNFFYKDDMDIWTKVFDMIKEIHEEGPVEDSFDDLELPEVPEISEIQE